MEQLDLKDTVELMGSKDYKERFIAEYLQTKIINLVLNLLYICTENGRNNYVKTTTYVYSRSNICSKK